METLSVWFADLMLLQHSSNMSEMKIKEIKETFTNFTGRLSKNEKDKFFQYILVKKESHAVRVLSESSCLHVHSTTDIPVSSNGGGGGGG